MGPENEIGIGPCLSVVDTVFDHTMAPRSMNLFELQARLPPSGGLNIFALSWAPLLIMGLYLCLGPGYSVPVPRHFPIKHTQCPCPLPTCLALSIQGLTLGITITTWFFFTPEVLHFTTWLLLTNLIHISRGVIAAWIHPFHFQYNFPGLNVEGVHWSICQLSLGEDRSCTLEKLPETDNCLHT